MICDQRTYDIMCDLELDDADKVYHNNKSCPDRTARFLSGIVVQLERQGVILPQTVDKILKECQ